MYYIPSPGRNETRPVTFNATGTTVRYIHAIGGMVFTSPPLPIPDQTITFLVPSPATAVFLTLPLCAAARRRRHTS
jgi:hypothetical protein